jgi:hypothetical protein
MSFLGGGDKLIVSTVVSPGRAMLGEREAAALLATFADVIAHEQITRCVVKLVRAWR